MTPAAFVTEGDRAAAPAAGALLASAPALPPAAAGAAAPMLSPAPALFFDPSPPFRPCAHRCQIARTRWEVQAARALRRRVFCQEQGLFGDDDTDAIDARAIPIVAMAMLGVAAGDVVGCVRIDEREPGVWWGSRLAVDPASRGAAPLAAELIRKAVCTARARGATAFFAHVQRANVRLFQRLHWDRLEKLDLHGRPHALMQADLAHYPALEPSRPIDIHTPRHAA